MTFRKTMQELASRTFVLELLLIYLKTCTDQTSIWNIEMCKSKYSFLFLFSAICVILLDLVLLFGIILAWNCFFEDSFMFYCDESSSFQDIRRCCKCNAKQFLCKQAFPMFNAFLKHNYTCVLAHSSLEDLICFLTFTLNSVCNFVFSATHH